MQTAANIATLLVAALHVYFLILEMFLWCTPKGMKTFGLTPEFAAASKTLAANQGLYNGFLAAGLVWGVVLGPAGNAIKLFFLSCVVIAGVYGAGHRKQEDPLRSGTTRGHSAGARAGLGKCAVVINIAAKAQPHP